MKWATVAVALSTFILAGTACGVGNDSPSSRVPVALGVPLEHAEGPIRLAKLVPGTRYLFQDVVPGLLDLELTAPTSTLYNYSDAGVAALATSPTFEESALWFIDVKTLRVPADPYFSAKSIAGQEDLDRIVRAAPTDVLRYFAGLAFADATRSGQRITVAGIRGRAVDLDIRSLPARAAHCASGSIRRCATITMVPGIGQTVQAGERYRIILLSVRNNQILVTQNLEVRGAQQVLDTLTFIPVM